MGCRNREFFSEDETSSPSPCETLLFATMCIIGLPVDVHVKDGSVYSGIFHTASVDRDYGIVLKKARMTKKGKGKANVGKEGLIDTLVILSGDLVQVVARGVVLPADGIGGNITGDDEEPVVSTVSCSEDPTCEVEKQKSTVLLMDKKHANRSSESRSAAQTENGFVHGLPPAIAENEHKETKSHLKHLENSLEINPEKTDEISLQKIKATSASAVIQRQVGDDKSKGPTDDCKQKFEFVKGSVDKSHSPRSSHEIPTFLTQVESVENGHKNVTSKHSVIGLSCNHVPLSVKSGNHCEGSISAHSASTNVTHVVDLAPETRNLQAKPVEISASRNAESTKSTKEFKLNPAAKVFSPSSVNPNLVSPAVPTVANMGYIPISSPLVPVAAIQPEVGFSTFVSQPSMPVKVAHYSNLTMGNGGSGPQFPQPIAGLGQLAHRTQPLRYAGHYNPVLAESAYLQPSSPALMVGRSGQLVYVPVSHVNDLVHGATGISPVSARPLSNLNHVQFPKQQGAAVGQPMQLCVPPPVLASGQHPFAPQNHIPLLQPTFPAIRPIPVPASNGFYSTKFS